ncbi:MAG: ribosomal subunit interface protein [Candidatus Pacebacteria bacterium CG10_big_fil_rev_8_21_14_0_10_56_10]|nr:MAG: ribosomal subunit interface protein [Candidatus Pacebacteria bacterium CG10_big_fil_rev_8_21_14_0_10_56_10]
MRIIVQSKTVRVTQALRAFVRKQALKMLKHQRVIGVRVYLETVAKRSNDPQGTTVKYQVEVPGKDIVVKRQAADLYQAIASATRRALRQVRKAKEKRITTGRRTDNRR